MNASQVISGAIGLEQISHTRLPFLEGEHIDGWRIGFFIGAFPLLYAMLIHFAIPETPQFYAAHDQKGKCISQLRMYEKKVTGSTELIDDIADGGIVFPTKAIHKSSPRELFSKRFIKGTLAIWIGYFCGCFMVYSMNAWLPRMCGSLGYDYTLATIRQYYRIQEGFL